ncbi:MAG: hypothetical protein ACKKL5_00050 [Candidatus Komeilibacteria bacterium]
MSEKMPQGERLCQVCQTEPATIEGLCEFCYAEIVENKFMDKPREVIPKHGQSLKENQDLQSDRAWRKIHKIKKNRS